MFINEHFFVKTLLTKSKRQPDEIKVCVEKYLKWGKQISYHPEY